LVWDILTCRASLKEISVGALSDEAARVLRDDRARSSEMMAPGIPR
jgi:hypothetical protein